MDLEDDNLLESLFADMFTGCTKLVGGNGTHFDEAHNNLLYAHPDVAGNPGYFTKKDGSPTGISNAERNDNGERMMDNRGEVYDLQGRKLDGQPMKSGLYIKNGRKVVVK